jgi:hypothetical protein
LRKQGYTVYHLELVVASQPDRRFKLKRTQGVASFSYSDAFYLQFLGRVADQLRHIACSF